MQYMNPFESFKGSSSKEEMMSMLELIDRDVRISERRDYGGDFMITVCDGMMHHTVSGGSYDDLLATAPCNHECEHWKAAKGKEILKDIPNLIQCDLRSDAYISPSYRRYLEDQKFESESKDLKEKLFDRLQEIGGIVSGAGISPHFSLANRNAFNYQWQIKHGIKQYPLGDGMSVIFDSEHDDWTVCLQEDVLNKEKVIEALNTKGVSFIVDE